jgi:hypothetical protein
MFKDSANTAANIAGAYLRSTTANQAYNYGTQTTLVVGFNSLTDYRESVLRFEKLLDSLRVYLSSDTGTWTIDSGRATLNCAVTLGTDDSLVLGMVRLKSGRLFEEGTGATNTGVSWDHYTGTTHWDTDGGLGTNDTTGGIIDSTVMLGPAAPAADGKVSFKLRAVDLADTTNYSGWLIYYMYTGLGETTPSTQVISFDSDDATEASERPMLKVYLTKKQCPSCGLVTTLNARGTNTMSGYRGTNTGGSVRGKQ